tara:strand:- start:1704 stop:2456 length:753 start_codon:yes stop_codon:yes gene_type:complete
LSIIKKLLPTAGAILGSAFGPGGAAIGGGIGSLFAGGSLEDAILTAGLSFGGAKMFPGVGPAVSDATGLAATEAASEVARMSAVEAAATEAAGKDTLAALAKEAAGKGILSGLSNAQLLGLGGIGGALAGGLLGDEEEEELTDLQRRQLATGERAPDVVGQNIVLEYDYPMGIPGLMKAAEGGFIQGPGTGRSDSIDAGIFQNGQKVQEARLSDGEFVMTAAAVRGAGDGDRQKGAARMYDMMKNYEAMA